MKTRTFKLLIIGALLSIFLIINPSIHAVAPYITTTLDRYGQWQETQDAYEPTDALKISFNGKLINRAQDFVIDENDYMYIADTGNRRVVIVNDQQKAILSFGEDKLYNPTGIFVRDHLIYIADYNDSNGVNKGYIYIYRYDMAENTVTLEKELETPKSKIFEIDNYVYKPKKIAVDDAGTMYVICDGSTAGVLMINSSNRFINYFAPNNVTYTVWDKIKNFLYGGIEGAKITKKIPTPPTNVMIDNSGYIYTLTKSTIEGETGDNYKKVNIGGINFFPKDMITNGEFVDSYFGKVGNTFAVTASGYIFEYDSEGNILFRFAGKGDGVDKMGLFGSASAITLDSKNNIYVIDDTRNTIQVFRETNFALQVHQALDLYNNAKYEDALDNWQTVLRYNSMFDMAHRGVGLAYFMNGEYKKALDKFYVANDRTNYSEAFWEIRNEWLIENLYSILIALMIFVVLTIIIKKTNRRYHYLDFIKRFNVKVKSIPLVSQLMFGFRYLKNPADSCYEVRAHKKATVLSATIFLLVITILYVMGLVWTGFLFNNTIIENTILLREAFKIIFPVILFIVANYLMSSLMEGEGTFKNTYINIIHALAPIVILYPVIILVSNFITLNESFLYTFGITVMLGWSGIMVFANIKETHNYTVLQTLINILLTLLMVIILILIIILVYIMSSQVIGFVSDIVKEVIMNE